MNIKTAHNWIICKFVVYGFILCLLYSPPHCFHYTGYKKPRHLAGFIVTVSAGSNRHRPLGSS